MLSTRILRKTFLRFRFLHKSSAGVGRNRNANHTDRRTQSDDELLYDENESFESRYLDDIGQVAFEGRMNSNSQKIRRNEVQEEREFLKRKIVGDKERKLYQTKKMPNLLTWAARMQIQHLYETDPDYWTPKMLASSFPVTVDSARKIIKNKRLLNDEKAIAAFDKKVYNNWIRLKDAMEIAEGKSFYEIPEEDRVYVEAGRIFQHLLPYAAGNAAHSVPPPSFAFLTLKQAYEDKKPVVKPVFSSLLPAPDKDKLELKIEESSTDKVIGYGEDSIQTLLEGIAKSKLKDTTKESESNELVELGINESLEDEVNGRNSRTDNQQLQVDHHFEVRLLSDSESSGNASESAYSGKGTSNRKKPQEDAREHGHFRQHRRGWQQKRVFGDSWRSNQERHEQNAYRPRTNFDNPKNTWGIKKDFRHVNELFAQMEYRNSSHNNERFPHPKSKNVRRGNKEWPGEVLALRTAKYHDREWTDEMQRNSRNHSDKVVNPNEHRNSGFHTEDRVNHNKPFVKEELNYAQRESTFSREGDTAHNKFPIQYSEAKRTPKISSETSGDSYGVKQDKHEEGGHKGKKNWV